MTQTLDDKLQAWVGRSTGNPVTADLPVNEAMIAHWCGAMGDRNPLYASHEVAPPTMLQVWTMRPFAADIPLEGGFEAWRGDTSADTVEGWDPRDAAEMATWDDSTEGEEEMEGWPEDLAGPEYWMYKRLTD